MKKSIFQFSNPRVCEVVFVENKEMREEKQGSLEVELNVEITRSDVLPEAVVVLTVTIGVNEDAPFKMRVVEEANFIWEKGTDEAEIEPFLKQNAPALLLGYVRPIVANITLASRSGAYDLPFINFRESK